MYSASRYFHRSRKLWVFHRYVIVILAVILVACSPVLAGDAGPLLESGIADRAEMEAFFDEAVPAGLAQYNIPGATVSVVQDGELIFFQGVRVL